MLVRVISCDIPSVALWSDLQSNTLKTYYNEYANMPCMVKMEVKPYNIFTAMKWQKFRTLTKCETLLFALMGSLKYICYIRCIWDLAMVWSLIYTRTCIHHEQYVRIYCIVLLVSYTVCRLYAKTGDPSTFGL